jgi:hypothetical protein
MTNGMAAQWIAQPTDAIIPSQSLVLDNPMDETALCFSGVS